MIFGVITERDIATEMTSRGITVSTAPPPPDGAPPDVVIPPPDSPEDAITILPIVPVVYPEPYTPVYPPPTVVPEDVVTTEVLPYIPGVTEPEKAGGISKGILILAGITAFALVALAKPKKPQQRSAYMQRRRV